jgi:hypothetical protein
MQQVHILTRIGLLILVDRLFRVVGKFVRKYTLRHNRLYFIRLQSKIE